MCSFHALMSSDVVVPKSDFEILPTKLKSPLFCLDDPMYVCCGVDQV